MGPPRPPGRSMARARRLGTKVLAMVVASSCAFGHALRHPAMATVASQPGPPAARRTTTPLEVYRHVAALPHAKLSRFAASFGAGAGQPLEDPADDLFRGRLLAGLVTEEDPAAMPALSMRLPASNVTKVNAWVTPLSALHLLQSSDAPLDIDYMKVDLGGFDCAVAYSILKAAYKPKILQLSVNPEVPYPVAFGVNYAPQYRPRGAKVGFYGCSATLAAAIVEPVGYYPVAVTPGHDAVFLRADLLGGSLQRLPVPELQEALEACCLPTAPVLLGKPPAAWRSASPPQLLAMFMPVVQHACVVSQGEAKCTAPYTLSLNPNDFPLALEATLAAESSALAR